MHLPQISGCGDHCSVNCTDALEASLVRNFFYSIRNAHLAFFYYSTAGTVSIMTMVVIGYDRYNVIVKGFSGTKITAFKAFVINLFIWAYACGTCLPPFFGWGNYALEGLFMTCSYDYMTEDWNTKTFILYAFIFNYCVPMLAVIFFYSQIAQAVFLHEAALRNQAKKMNVDSLRSGQVSEILLESFMEM